MIPGIAASQTGSPVDENFLLTESNEILLTEDGQEIILDE